MTTLQNTSLCAIVRDEIMNPAGGIVDFVESTAPFVEEAVILDTGSVDGTREKLDELKTKHPNLRVVHHPFEGYVTSRNRALSSVRTSRVLILDADERLTREDFVNLGEMTENTKDFLGFNFRIIHIRPNGEYTNEKTHNPR